MLLDQRLLTATTHELFNRVALKFRIPYSRGIVKGLHFAIGLKPLFLFGVGGGGGGLYARQFMVLFPALQISLNTHQKFEKFVQRRGRFYTLRKKLHKGKNILALGDIDKDRPIVIAQTLENTVSARNLNHLVHIINIKMSSGSKAVKSNITHLFGVTRK